MPLHKMLDKIFGREVKQVTKNVFLETARKEANTSFSNQKAERLYNAVDVVNRSIDLISTNFANVDFLVKEKKSDGTLVEIPNHELKQLIDKPNGIQGGRQFKYSTMTWRLVNGNSYNYLVTTGGNSDYTKPVAMFSLQSNSVTLNATTRDYFYRVSTQQGKGYIQPVDNKFPLDIITGDCNILNWNAFNTNSMIQGRSAIEPINTNANIYENANQWNADYFDNGCKLSYILAVKSTGDYVPTPDELDEIQKRVNENFTGMGNNDKPFVTADVDPRILSNNAKDSDFIQSLKKQESAIARSLGVPPILLNSGEGSTFSNQQEAQERLWTDTIIPYVNEYVEELNNQLSPRYGQNIVIVPDYSKVEALIKQTVLKIQSLETVSFLTINEKRKMVNMDDIDGGDTLYVASGNIPLDIASSGLGLFDETTDAQD